MARLEARCISAWAEEPSVRRRPDSHSRVHLRVGGGTRATRGLEALRRGASPRGRRNRWPRSSSASRDGCISAWAEEPCETLHASCSARVHLRVGGGTERARRRLVVTKGASPRGRRNPLPRVASRARARCISAWAEEPADRSASSRLARVHLRVGGGTPHASIFVVPGMGASPRGRRNRWEPSRDPLRDGCISAWAEEPHADLRRDDAAPVHLRVGGGTRVALTHSAAATGASPRGRRNPRATRARAPADGCISAWAEEPSTPPTSLSPIAVHLRVGGGTSRRERKNDHGRGASPRGRRNPLFIAAYYARPRCISAWAEEPRCRTHRRRRARVHLRVGGGTAVPHHDAEGVVGASPRGRRNRAGEWACAPRARCISAWAEEPPLWGSAPAPDPVHLRVGGGTRRSHRPRVFAAGASPRGRRNPLPSSRRIQRARCISAWAEEPARSRAGRRLGRVHLRVGGGTQRDPSVAVSRRGASPRGRRNL